MSSCRFCFLQSLEQQTIIAANGPRPGGYKNFMWLKRLTPTKKKCNNNLCRFLCRAVQKATLRDMEGSCEHVEHVWNAHTKICRVRWRTSEPLLFCSLNRFRVFGRKIFNRKPLRMILAHNYRFTPSQHTYYFGKSWLKNDLWCIMCPTVWEQRMCIAIGTALIWQLHYACILKTFEGCSRTLIDNKKRETELVWAVVSVASLSKRIDTCFSNCGPLIPNRCAQKSSYHVSFFCMTTEERIPSETLCFYESETRLKSNIWVCVSIGCVGVLSACLTTFSISEIIWRRWPMNGIGALVEWY